MTTTKIWACSKADASMVHHLQVQVQESRCLCGSTNTGRMPVPQQRPDRPAVFWLPVIYTQVSWKILIYRSVRFCEKSCLYVCAILNLIMTSAKKKSEKPNSDLTTMQIFSKALTGGSEWCDKVNTTIFTAGYTN